MQGYTPPPPGGYGAPANPYAGYAPPTMVEPRECPLARQALGYAIVGLFCLGIFLGPMAVSKARAAKAMIAANPGMRGEGMATAALILGVMEIALWVFAIFARIVLH